MAPVPAVACEQEGSARRWRQGSSLTLLAAPLAKSTRPRITKLLGPRTLVHVPAPAALSQPVTVASGNSWAWLVDGSRCSDQITTSEVACVV